MKIVFILRNKTYNNKIKKQNKIIIKVDSYPQIA